MGNDFGEEPISKGTKFMAFVGALCICHALSQCVSPTKTKPGNVQSFEDRLKAVERKVEALDRGMIELKRDAEDDEDDDDGTDPKGKAGASVHTDEKIYAGNGSVLTP